MKTNTVNLGKIIIMQKCINGLTNDNQFNCFSSVCCKAKLKDSTLCAAHFNYNFVSILM